MDKKTLKIRPYARLLTMLGDQLIKNEQIALIELIKNSYDADADWVKVSFENFGNNLEVLPNSKIIIEDNGEGMSLKTIEKSWMNPATPNKFVKKGESRKTKKKKRIIQGEKGIGRFSILKLGMKILITTRPVNCDDEFEINYDLSAYDDNFLTENGEEKELFIDDLNIEVHTKKVSIIVDKEINVGHQIFNRGNHGTRIEITQLKGKWNDNKIKNIYDNISKLESIFDKIFKKNIKNGFTIGVYLNGKIYSVRDDYIDKLSGLFDTKAVFKISNGEYNSLNKTFTFLENGISKSIDIDAPNFKQNRVFRERFCINEKDEKTGKEKCIGKYRTPECGNFSFNFFIFDFDFAKKVPAKYLLDSKDKKLIKKHRIYLYRDDIRVFPYGDPEDDWLKIDTLRGIWAAGLFFSNDQVVGWIKISKAGNPDLKDKTNREGLIDEGNATQDFTTLIQSFLSYYRLHQFKQYQENNKDKTKQDIFRTEEVKRQYEEIKKQFVDNPTAINAINNLYTTYSKEREYLIHRVEATEDLASVGLSVETASHDFMLMLSKGILGIDDLMKDCMGGSVTIDKVNDELQKLRGIFSFVETQMKDIQLLFRSTKQRRRNIRVDDILQKVVRIYKNTLTKAGIELETEKIGSPLIAKCTDAVLLQLFINLFDNSIFWLTDINIKKKNIIIKLDGNNGELIFSDNGPGINKDDAPYIFEAFYSSKEEGRGLGLYIAKQLLERIDYSIWLADIKAEKVLGGANFVVSFVKQGE